MISSPLLICANGAVRDATDNTITIFQILEDMQAVGFPVFVQKMSIYFSLRRENDDSENINSEIIIKHNENVLFKKDVEINFQNKLKHNMIVNLQSLLIPGPGVLQVLIQYDGTQLNDFSINVTISGQTELAVTSEE